MATISDSEPLPADDDSSYVPYDPNTLLEQEEFWRDHQVWLAEKGYMLRPRFRPDWKPSWQPGDLPSRYEDGSIHLLDATRLSDNSLVMLKHIDRNVHPHELEIGQYFSQEPLLSHPKNHCVPVFDVLDIPNSDNESILVMPLLREYDNPRLKSVGEAVDYFRQIFEGLQFMHQCHVAHRYKGQPFTPWTCLISSRDCMNRNIMMDPKPTFPKLYHPSDDRRNLNFKGRVKYYTRTARPTKYFLIDFGLSRKYNPEDGEPREIPIKGGDKTVPEFRGRGEFKARNPFPTDIYYLGNMIREDFLQVCVLVTYIHMCRSENLSANEGSRVYGAAGERHGPR
ncbi:hypothetical protein NLI96_g7320 [Meripilus lineatus]|uniref:Protein kinase domain-containing protein n=1 Tax=Meripilus lineatus TaxID=2056292 RepID=A0AAD5UZA2_9APHY|nr:hypothetical protein NLI96_g7320 [Physisporinus lineatus]